MGQQEKERVVVSLDNYRKGKIQGMQQDGSREWITLLAAIVGDGTCLSPAIIMPGEAGYVGDTWIQDYEYQFDNRALFAVTKSGWINSDLALQWLKRIVEPETAAAAAGGQYRLLLLDGHSCHLTMDFLNYCLEKRIILGFLPPHTTHMLQPLDVGIFGPLAIAYSRQL